MDNILGFLIIAGGVIYKIYTEYAKEQEKAAKRNLKKPTVEQVPSPAPAREKVIPIPAPAAPRKTRPVNSPIKSQQVKPKSIQERVIKQEIPEEVLRIRKAKELERRKQPSKVLAVQELGQENVNKENYDFDLRKAVIQAAILERPNY